ncbi:hypothetical protein PHYBOEH_008973 [Phytophthora boehmeriae]|uniref:Uncharacterized protein n=1 Tax=Phytophthora boehmeriae TaxID=109152 RepID=A0A8T1VW96_9STRA|nr:hypothetical protein PHYBOEH_008973 [Phytophthora boehmeriae]
MEEEHGCLWSLWLQAYKVSSTASIDEATECAYEQVGDGDSCYLKPRSCYDCLNAQLSSGQDVYPVHYNYFPVANATYCEPNDAACNSCKQSVFAVGNRNPSA